MYSSTTDPLGSFIGFQNGVGSGTTIGRIFNGAMVSIPTDLFLNFIEYILIVAVFGAALAIGWSLWRRFV